jgi:hypothetical protein
VPSGPGHTAFRRFAHVVVDLRFGTVGFGVCADQEDVQSMVDEYGEKGGNVMMRGRDGSGMWKACRF